MHSCNMVHTVSTPLFFRSRLAGTFMCVGMASKIRKGPEKSLARATMLIGILAITSTSFAAWQQPGMTALASQRARSSSVFLSEQQPSLPPPQNDEEPAESESSLEDDYKAGVAFGKDIISRFTSPVIDDPGLPYADSLVCICGSLFVSSVALKGLLPRPSWLVPFLPAGVEGIRGLPYIVPAWTHGAGLALCWTLGALAASAFERGAYMGTLPEAIARCWKAGAFAVGVLLLSTQASTFVSLASQGIDPLGPSPQADEMVLTNAFEIICDVAVQAAGLTAFRIFRWYDAQPK